MTARNNYLLIAIVLLALALAVLCQPLIAVAWPR
jgi:hypothetical protein